MNTDSQPNDLSDDFGDDFESIAEQHRMAAHHFTLAARHHLAAADANESGETALAAQHAFLAYRHRLAANQYAEIAAMDDDSLDDLDDFQKEMYEEQTDGSDESPVTGQ